MPMIARFRYGLLSALTKSRRATLFPAFHSASTESATKHHSLPSHHKFACFQNHRTYARLNQLQRRRLVLFAATEGRWTPSSPRRALRATGGLIMERRFRATSILSPHSAFGAKVFLGGWWGPSWQPGAGLYRGPVERSRRHAQNLDAGPAARDRNLHSRSTLSASLERESTPTPNSNSTLRSNG